MIGCKLSTIVSYRTSSDSRICRRWQWPVSKYSTLRLKVNTTEFHGHMLLLLLHYVTHTNTKVYVLYERMYVHVSYEMTPGANTCYLPPASKRTDLPSYVCGCMTSEMTCSRTYRTHVLGHYVSASQLYTLTGRSVFAR